MEEASMDPIKLLEASFAWAGERVAQVRPDQLDSPTPCAKWDLRGLLNHLIGAMDQLARLAGGDREPGPFSAEALAQVDRIGDDPLAAYQETAERALAVWHTPGVLERMCEMPLGPMPASVAVRISATDAVVHGWDVSRATGERAEIPAELAEPLLEFGKKFVHEGVRRRVFAEPVPLADGSPSDQLVAFLGRRP
jgi:uncharacterized protein (TIGR03086 family)